MKKRKSKWTHDGILRGYEKVVREFRHAQRLLKPFGMTVIGMGPGLSCYKDSEPWQKYQFGHNEWEFVRMLLEKLEGQ